MNCTGISGAICILSWLVCMPLIVKQLKREINKNKSKEIRYYRISNIKGKLNTNPHKSIHFAIYNLFFCAACFCFFFIRCILFSILLLWRFFLFLYLQCAFSIIDIIIFITATIITSCMWAHMCKNTVIWCFVCRNHIYGAQHRYMRRWEWIWFKNSARQQNERLEKYFFNVIQICIACLFCLRRFRVYVEFSKHSHSRTILCYICVIQDGYGNFVWQSVADGALYRYV